MPNKPLRFFHLASFFKLSGRPLASLHFKNSQNLVSYMNIYQSFVIWQRALNNPIPYQNDETQQQNLVLTA